MISPKDAIDSTLGSASRHVRGLVVVVVLGVLVTLVAPLVGAASDGAIETMYLLVDPVDVAGTPWYLGAISELNLLLWAAAASLYLVAWRSLRSSRPELASAMLGLGLVSVWFALDDQFLIHEERIFEVLGAIGIAPALGPFEQPVVYLVYGLVLAGVLLRYATAVLRVEGLAYLVLALGALGLSILLDASGIDLTSRRVAEEGAKLVGAVAWVVFPAHLLVGELRDRVEA